MSDCPHGDKIGELEAEVKRLTIAANTEILQLGEELGESQAQLRDAQEQVAALKTSAVALVHTARRAAQYGDSMSPYLHTLKNRAAELETVYADLPAASQAIRAAAEREPGLREALEEIEAMPWFNSESPYAKIARAALSSSGQCGVCKGHGFVWKQLYVTDYPKRAVDCPDCGTALEGHGS